MGDEGGNSGTPKPMNDEGNNGESLEPMNDEGGNGESLEPMNDEGGNGESLEPMNDEGDNGGNLETDNNNDSTVDTNRVCRAENSMTEDVCNSSNNKTIPDYPYNLQGDPPSSRNSPRNFNHPTTPNRTNTSTVLERLFILIVNLTKIFRIPPMGIITRRIICDSKWVIRVLVTNYLLLKLTLVMMMTNEKQR